MMVGVPFAPYDLGPEMPQRILETLRRGDAREGRNRFAHEPVEGELFPAPDVFERPRRVGAFYDFGFSVVTAYFGDDSGRVAPALRQKYYVGAFKMPRRLAENAARQHIAVAERVRRVDENNLDGMLEFLILKTVVENYRVATETLDGVAPGFNAVAVDDHGDARQIGREHVRLVAADGRIEKNALSVGYDERRIDNLREHALPPRRLFAAVTARENRHLSALGGERPCEEFGDRSLARSAGGHVADRNHLNSERIAAQKTDAVEEVPYGDDARENDAERLEKTQQQNHRKRLVLIGPFFENHLYEVFLEPFDTALFRLAHRAQSPNIDPAFSPSALK